MSTPTMPTQQPDGSFSVSGLIAGQPSIVTWHPDGTLSGDAAAVQYIETMAQLYESQPLGYLFSMPTTHDHLKSAASAYALMTMCCAERPVQLGAVPGMLIDDVRGERLPESDADTEPEGATS